MKDYNRYINLILIAGGAAVAFYAQSNEPKIIGLMIFGLILLAVGLYRTSRNIPDKNTDKEESLDDDFKIDDTFNDKKDLKN